MPDDQHAVLGGLRLDVGSVKSTRGFKGVDIGADADYRIDLEKGGIPVDDRAVSIISSSHLLEHLDFDSVIKTLTEFYRMLKPDGYASIVVPDTDTNSFWKGFLDHKDMRMNPYLFRSASSDPHNPLLAHPYFMRDYDGYGFGMLQGYMSAKFDFDMLHFKIFPMYKYAACSEAFFSFAARSYNNTIDQYRFIVRPKDGAWSGTYAEALTELPEIELHREMVCIAQRVRRFNDLANMFVNHPDQLPQGLLATMMNLEVIDFRDNLDEIFQSIDADCRSLEPIGKTIKEWETSRAFYDLLKQGAINQKIGL